MKKKNTGERRFSKMGPLGPLFSQTGSIAVGGGGGGGSWPKLINFRENLGYLLPVKFYWHTWSSFRVQAEFAILNKSPLSFLQS